MSDQTKMQLSEKDATFDLTSRQAAIDAVHKAIFKFFDIVEDDSESPMTYQDKRLLELNKSITQKIEAVPSVEAVPVVHGRWIDKDGGLATCSECGDRWGAWDVMNFCPTCGAKMDGRESEMEEQAQEEQAQHEMERYFDMNGDPYIDFNGNPW